MHDALVSLNENAIGMSATTGKEVLPTGRLTYTAPFGIFRAPDGYICIAVLGERVWQRFCRAIERPDLAEDESLASGTARSAAMDGELGSIVEDWVAALPRDEAVRRLVSAGVPAGIVATPFDVIDSEQAQARDLLWDVSSYTGGTFRAVASPIRLTPGGFADPGAVPQPGRDTEAVLEHIGGLDSTEIEELVRRGVVGTGE
jgi:formyl-CoA transferase